MSEVCRPLLHSSLPVPYTGISCNSDSSISGCSTSSSSISSIDSVKIKDKDVRLVRPCKTKYICVICTQLLNDPVQTIRGMLACKSCYESRQRIKGECPIDGEPIKEDTEVFSDKSISMEIKNLECICLYDKYGCRWIGALADINIHEDNCEYREITCSECGNNVVCKLLDEHKENECLYRSKLCRYCEKKILYAEMQIHEERCINKPSLCPFKCSEILKAGEIHLHVEKCSNILNGVICPYNAFGCTCEPTDKETLERHFVTDNIPHIALVIDSFNTIKNEVHGLREELCQERTHRASIENELQQLKDKVSRMSQDHETQMKKIGEESKTIEHENCLREANNRVKALDDFMRDFQFEKDESFQKLVSMQKQLDTLVPGKDLVNYVQNNKYIVQVKEKVDRYETDLAQCVSQIADAELNLQLVENTTYDGRLIWKIDNFAYRTRQAEIGKVTVLHSAPCFTKKFEYKFCARLYLNGDGVGRCSHLSLFICFMKSQLDDQLEWPVVKKVTFRLLHPSNKAKSHSEWFITDKNSSSFKKPKREMNIAAGCPQFMKKEDVMSEGFLINDSIYIETLVESPLSKE